MLSFKPTFSLSSFTFIKKLFSYSSLSAIRVMPSAYLRLLIFLPAILIPACASSSTAYLMMYSAYKLSKQGDSIQLWCTPFPIWNQSVVPCPVLTVPSYSPFLTGLFSFFSYWVVWVPYKIWILTIYQIYSLQLFSLISIGFLFTLLMFPVLCKNFSVYHKPNCLFLIYCLYFCCHIQTIIVKASVRKIFPFAFFSEFYNIWYYF